MKIKVDFENPNLDDIRAALDAVNGKASSFTVSIATSVVEIAKAAEAYLADHKVVVSERPGAAVLYRPAGPTANAYRYGAISTSVRLIRTSSGWYLAGVERCKVYPRRAERFEVTIGDPAAANLIKRTLIAFGRHFASELVSA